MACNVPKSIITHSQRVCRLYKKTIRLLEMQNVQSRIDFRFDAVLMRQRFEETRKEKDMRKMVIMLEEAEEELFQNWPLEPFIFRDDPGGITRDRVPIPGEDRLFDLWHPWDKAPYIDYFELREKRKEEMVDYFEKSYMKKGVVDLEKTEYPLRN